MSRRKNRVGFFDRAIALFAALLLFVGLAFFLWNNLQKEDRDVVIAHDADEIATIAATTISADELKKQKDKILKEEKEKKRKEKQLAEDEKKKLEEIKNQKEKEKQRLKELKAEKEKRIEEEKAIALKKKKEADAEKKRKLEEKKRKERERKKKIADEKKRKEREKAEKEKQAQEARENALRSELAAEISARKSTTVFNRYVALIKNKLQSNFIAPVGAPPGMIAIVNIRLDESGNVLSSRIVKGSGNFAYDQAALAAVGKASPLPMPQEDPSANQRLRDINLEANF